MTEPLATAVFLTTAGLLLVMSVVFGRVLGRMNVPTLLIFLAIGMVAGSDGLGGIHFADYELAFRLGTLALVLILFDGGLNTPMAAFTLAARPAIVLATAGVIGTAALLAGAARLIGFGWPEALLLGAVVSSTDAAAVFAVLRGSGLQLRRRVGATLEVESGLNDPTAVILTTVLTMYLLDPEAVKVWGVPFTLIAQLGVGAALGLGVGWAGRGLLRVLRLSIGGLYPVLTLAIALLAFGVPTLLWGSGFLAVYLAGLVLGNSELPMRATVLRVHDSLAWLSQIGMFLMLGLLVFPSQLAGIAGVGAVLAVGLTLVARPLVVGLCLWPFRFPFRQVVYIGWVGLRGAVPIILATVPILAGAPGAERLFHVVFFIVVVSALVAGGTVPWLTRRLDIETATAAPPPAQLQVEALRPLRGELLSFSLTPDLAVTGAMIGELPLSPGTAVALVLRGNELLPALPTLRLEPEDAVYVLTDAEGRSTVELLFGRPEET